MFRRRTSGTPEAPDTAADSAAPGPEQASRQRTAAKGRPTPKRSEAEPRRPAIGGQPAARKAGGSAGPGSGRTSGRRSPADRRAAAADRRERYAADMAAMRRGDQSRMKPVDRGRVKQLARDYVDSRRVMLSEWILVGMFLLIIMIFVTSAMRGKGGGSGGVMSSGAVLLTELVILLVVVLEGIFHGSRVISLVKKRYPGESTRGLIWYVIKRSIRLRGTRVPPPRDAISRGGSF